MMMIFNFDFVNGRQEFTEEIPFQKNCKEPKCRYDLSLFASVLENEAEGFIIGKYGRLTLEIMINHESGEPAYRPRLNIRFPKSLELIRDISSCSLKELEDSKLLVCNLAVVYLGTSR
ncbi:uncharacterized protein LOC111707791 [Eurytemora carolleeae]|uniref:uncharacterized protein LOC111707791 n=1 Tax=Eurytemora carolleeae TaxID=1294199 RepID=UPI000C77C61A|nr:uncharacterized protein LOC111707791 [Eurytemora carolleeae]|eukprot:XP_023336716.1 uncharacterized protein LOC111707791 [Eurytemora affinis]